MNLKNIFIYYFLLLVVLCSWSDTVNAPNIIFRLAYLVALVFPIFKAKPNMLPHILICFTSISIYGFSASYLPTEYYYYTYIVLFLCILPFKNKKSHINIPPILIILATYTLVIDFIFYGKLENIQYGLFLIIFLIFFVSKDNKYNYLYPYVYIVITLTLCYFFFAVGDQFVVEHLGQDRVMWKDPNYMGSLAGVGIVCSYHLLTSKQYSKKIVKYILLATICIGAIMLMKNASRGAFICVASGIIIITLFSKISLKKKITIALLLLISIVLMYQIGLFSALEERVMHDEDGTGSGRTIIWAYKISLFLEQPIYKLFTGLGYRGGFMLGFYDGYGFHNDFVAFFVDYGIIGTILFISFLLYPLIIVRKNKEQQAIVTALSVYLILCCMTLEPLSGGRLPFCYLYLFIYILAKQGINTKQNSMQ